MELMEDDWDVMDGLHVVLQVKTLKTFRAHADYNFRPLMKYNRSCQRTRPQFSREQFRHSSYS
jgi:hypothetical protein